MAPPKPGGGKAKKGTTYFCFSCLDLGLAKLLLLIIRKKKISIFTELYWIFLTVTGIIKLALEAGKATPAPPVGPALGSKGVNIMAFCKDYNARTADKAGYVIPVEITVYDVCCFPFINLRIFKVYIYFSDN